MEPKLCPALKPPNPAGPVGSLARVLRFHWEREDNLIIRHFTPPDCLLAISLLIKTTSRGRAKEMKRGEAHPSSFCSCQQV